MPFRSLPASSSFENQPSEASAFFFHFSIATLIKTLNKKTWGLLDCWFFFLVTSKNSTGPEFSIQAKQRKSIMSSLVAMVLLCAAPPPKEIIVN